MALRTNPEHQQHSPFTLENAAKFGSIIAVIAAAYVISEQDAATQTESASHSDESSETSETGALGPAIPEVIATAIPLMPEEEDTPLGLNSAAVDIEFNTIQDFVDMLAQTDVASRQVQDENFLYRSFRAPFIPNIDRMNPLTPEDLGLGHSEAATADYAREQEYYESLITSSSRRDAESTDNVEVVTFRTNILLNDSYETVYFTENGFATSTLIENQYDNLDPMGFQQILDSLKVITVDGTRVWDLTTEAQRLEFALAVWNGLDAQREDGPIGAPVERPITFLNEDGEVEVLAVTNTAGESGIRVRRIQRTQNGEDQPTEQRLTSECVIVVEQPNGIHTEISRGEISRFEHVASIMTLDLNELNRIAESTDDVDTMLALLADAIIHDHAAYERLSLDTTYAGFPESQTAEGDMGFFMRPDCYVAPEIIPTEVPPVEPTQPPHEPTCEELNNCERPTPTPTPPKTDAYDTNPNGNDLNDPNDTIEEADPTETTSEEANNDPFNPEQNN